MTAPFRIAIAGLGTVGGGVVALLRSHADIIAARAGRTIEIVAVSARDRNRDRGVDLSSCAWVDDPLDLIGRADAIVEAIGGADGIARDLVESSLRAGIPVITANKAMLAEHGAALADLSEQAGAPLCYEAAVAGGIPVIKALREGLAGNEVCAVYGILNGTCNYILSTMRETGADFESVLAQAQAMGYAEADPSFDIDGIDAAHKLSILSALAFGVRPEFSRVHITGIRQVSADDIAHAGALGYRIKLLGTARRGGDGKIVQTMEPCLIPQGSAIGAVEGVFNAVCIEADPVGTALMVGRGAGAGPTASAVLSDIIDLARGAVRPVYGIAPSALRDGAWGDIGDLCAHYYMRVTVLDKPGVLADVAASLRDHGVSVEAVRQQGRNPDQPVSIVITTHDTPRRNIVAACDDIAVHGHILHRPVLMRIENL